MKRALGRATVLTVAICGAIGTQSASAMVSKCNVPITMSDGTVLRANVWLPDNAGATNRVPLVLTATGYNKDATNPTGSSCSGSGALATADTSLTSSGYAVMLLDDRGTGASGGAWDSWGQRTQTDYREVLDWIQAQTWSNGRVATTGASYMGITSFLIAEADQIRIRREGKPRAVAAVYADVPMDDAYRDVTFHGGAIDQGFIPLWLGLTTGLSDIPPSTTAGDVQSGDPRAVASDATTYAGHLRDGYDFAARKVVSSVLGADDATNQYGAYDGPFYQLRSPGLDPPAPANPGELPPRTGADKLDIPVAIHGGWWDIFQRGEPLLYETLRNSPDRVLVMSPHYHTSAGPAGDTALAGLSAKAWFDHFLKGASNGVENTPHVNLFTMNSGSGTSGTWQHFDQWPPPTTQYTQLYLDGGPSGSATSLNDGTAALTQPTTPGGDSAPLLPATSPCSRLTAQWTAGGASNPVCDTDNRTFEASSLTYTTAPLTSDLTVTGPIMANVWAELTGATDATLVAVLSDVGPPSSPQPSGASNQISAGFLLASQRAVDEDRSWFAPEDSSLMIRPFHPFTQASQKPVNPNDPSLYRIEIYPTSNVFKKGDRIRLTIATANTPGTATPVPALANQAGGTIRVLHGPGYLSALQLPVVP